MAIYPALGGISLILALLDKRLHTRRWSESIVASLKHGQQGFHTSNRASRCGVQPSTPHSSGFRAPPQSGISQSSTCICLPAEALTQAGPFLTNLGKMIFSAVSSLAFIQSCLKLWRREPLSWLSWRGWFGRSQIDETRCKTRWHHRGQLFKRPSTALIDGLYLGR